MASIFKSLWTGLSRAAMRRLDRVEAKAKRRRTPEAALSLDQLEERAVFAVATLDLGFGGGDGVMNQPGYTWNATQVQQDGRIVVAGTYDNNGNKDIAVMRLNANGSLDASFAGDGIMTIGIGSANDVGNDVVLGPNGTIIVAGTTSSSLTASQAVVVRLTSDGYLDTSFSGDGVHTFNMGSSRGTGEGVAVDGAGRIYVVGTDNTNKDGVVARLTTAGALDTSYAGDGTFNFANGLGTVSFHDIAVRADGSAVAVGESALLGLVSTIHAVGVTAAGKLDASFGVGGSTMAGLGLGGDNVGGQVEFDSQGRAVIGATTSVLGLLGAAAVLRLDQGGQLDSSFGGGDGIASIDVSLLNTSTISLAVDPNDNILVAGDGIGGLGILEVTGDNGLLNMLFNGDGLALLDLGNVTSTALALTGQGLALIGNDGLGGVVSQVLNGIGIGVLNPGGVLGGLLSVNEGSPVGTVIGTLTGTGLPVGEVLDFVLSPEDQAKGIFEIVDGVLRLVGELNFEDGPIQTVTVLATNGLETVTRTIEVLVNNLGPTGLLDLDGLANIVPVDAIGGTLVNITAGAVDAAGGLVTYLLGLGSDPRFVIDPVTGVVTTVVDAVFDITEGLIPIVVGATDGVSTVLETIFVQVVPPVVTPQQGLNVDGNVDGDAAVDVNEGVPANTPVANLTGTGFSGTNLTYTLLNDGGGRFKIVGNQIQTTGTIAVNYETSASYTITVQVTDGTDTIERTIGVTVNNLAPSTPTDTNNGANRVTVGQAAGTGVGVTAGSQDPAGGTITYSLTDDAGGRFVINQQTGIVTVAEGAQFAANDGSYTITVQASDGALTTTSNMTINVVVASNPGGGPGTVDPDPDPIDPNLPSLVVTGTEGNDKITITYKKGAYQVKLNGVKSQWYALPETARIYVYGLGGNDKIVMSTKSPNSAVIYGGEGNDKLYGGRGDDILHGGNGNDYVNGRGGRDILIGGGGIDKLIGAGSGSSAADEGNIFIGGTTAHDDNLAALRAISAAWAANVDTSMTTVRSYLHSETINPDAVQDQVYFTGKGIDWHLEFEAANARIDRIRGLRANDLFN